MQKKDTRREDPLHARRSLIFQILCLLMIVISVLVFIRTRDARGVYRSAYVIAEDGTRLPGGDASITLKSGGVAVMTFDSTEESASVHGRWQKDGGEITIAWEGGLGRITYDWSPRALVYDPPGKAEEAYERISH